MIVVIVGLPDVCTTHDLYLSGLAPGPKNEPLPKAGEIRQRNCKAGVVVQEKRAARVQRACVSAENLGP